MSIMAARDIHVSNSAITTIPGALATVILIDSTADPGTGTALAVRRNMPDIKRVRARVFCDQATTIFFEVLGRQSASNWSNGRIVNGGGAGQAITANTEFEGDFNVGSQDDWRVRVTTPAGAITVWDVSVRLSTDQSLAQ